jgi:hypothetical protein
MVSYITAQLLKLFDCYDNTGTRYREDRRSVAEQIATPSYAMYRDWDPVEGHAAWHHWEVGWKREDVERVIDRMAEYDGICICGEAYSGNQGWIEGALQATNRVLKKGKLIEKSVLEQQDESKQ